jgi:hypothetical protein
MVRKEGKPEEVVIACLKNYIGIYLEVDFFNWPNPSSRTMALGSTQPLTEMSTRKIPGG